MISPENKTEYKKLKRREYDIIVRLTLNVFSYYPPPTEKQLRIRKKTMPVEHKMYMELLDIYKRLYELGERKNLVYLEEH
jgi:hypothetical protein